MDGGSWRRTTALALIGLLTAACGSAGETAAPDEPEPWRTSQAPVTTAGMIWEADGTIHLSDGETLEAGEPVATYVVAGDGAFFVPEDAKDGAVQFVAAGEDPVETGLAVQADTLSASPDGRYVGGIDMVSGPEDDFGTPQATVRVFDLETGEEVVSSTEGMGDVGEDDLAVLYPELGLALQLTDDTAFVTDATPDGTVYDLATGEARPWPEGEEPPSLFEADADRSPGGEWTIRNRGLRDLLESSAGEQVEPRTGSDRWLLDFWADETTVVGTVIEGPGGGQRVDPRDSTALMSCTVPRGECTVAEESRGKKVQFPRGEAFILGFELQAGQ